MDLNLFSDCEAFYLRDTELLSQSSNNEFKGRGELIKKSKTLSQPSHKGVELLFHFFQNSELNSQETTLFPFYASIALIHQGLLTDALALLSKKENLECCLKIVCLKFFMHILYFCFQADFGLAWSSTSRPINITNSYSRS